MKKTTDQSDPFHIPPFLDAKKRKRQEGPAAEAAPLPAAPMFTNPEPSWRSQYPESAADVAAREVIRRQVEGGTREKKLAGLQRRVGRVRREGKRIPGATWDVNQSRWVHPGLTKTPAREAIEGDTQMAKKARKKAAPKENGAGRSIKRPCGAVADFTPVRADTARATVIEMGAKGRTVEEIGKAIKKDRKTVLTHLFCLNRDSSLGYEVDEADKVSLTFPGSKTVKDAIKEKAAE